MTKSLAFAVLLALTALATSGASLAQDTKAAQPKAMPPAASADDGAPMASMDEQMKKMQAMHDKMMNAKTAEERRKLMDEHRRTMQQGMSMMNQMMHNGSMMGGSAMMGSKAAPGDTNAQLQAMQKRMDMMQMMMQMMMDEQGMTGPAAGSMAAPKK
jgi:hypothetical protein